MKLNFNLCISRKNESNFTNALRTWKEHFSFEWAAIASCHDSEIFVVLLILQREERKLFLEYHQILQKTYLNRIFWQGRDDAVEGIKFLPIIYCKILFKIGIKSYPLRLQLYTSLKTTALMKIIYGKGENWK